MLTGCLPLSSLVQPSLALTRFSSVLDDPSGFSGVVSVEVILHLLVGSMEWA